MLQLTRDSAIYALGAVAGKAVGLLLLPILTRSLAPDEYGRLEILSTLGSALVSVLLLGIDRAALRLSFTERGAARRSTLGTWYVVATALALPPALLLAVASGPLSTLLFGDARFATAVALVGWITLLGTYQVIALTILRAERRPRAYAVLSGGSLLLNAALVIGSFAVAPAAVDLVLLAYALSLGAGAIVGAALVRRVGFGRPSRGAVSSLLALGLPLAPAVVATWLAELANRAIVLGVAGPVEVGYLGVGIRFASIAGLAIAGLQLAWEPHAYARGRDPEGLGPLARDARRVLVGIAALVAAIALVAREAVLLVSGAPYLPALPAFGFSSLAVLATGAFIVAMTPSLLAGAMRDIGAATLVGMGAGVGATFVLTGPYGGAGAAAGIAFGQLVAVVAVAWLGRTRSAIALPWRRITLVLVAAGAVTLASTTLDASPALRALFAGGFAAVLLVEGSIRPAIAAIVARTRP